MLGKLEEMKCPFTQLTRTTFFRKAGNERFTAAGLRCCENFSLENFLVHVQRDYFSTYRITDVPWSFLLRGWIQTPFQVFFKFIYCLGV